MTDVNAPIPAPPLRPKPVSPAVSPKPEIAQTAEQLAKQDDLGVKYETVPDELRAKYALLGVATMGICLTNFTDLMQQGITALNVHRLNGISDQLHQAAHYFAGRRAVR